jgi:hypothetical protein
VSPESTTRIEGRADAEPQTFTHWHHLPEEIIFPAIGMSFFAVGRNGLDLTFTYAYRKIMSLSFSSSSLPMQSTRIMPFGKIGIHARRFF